MYIKKDAFIDNQIALISINTSDKNVILCKSNLKLDKFVIDEYFVSIGKLPF